MASCSTCGSMILFGGKRVGDYRFCNDTCLARGQYLTLADQIPDESVEEFARGILQSPCPKCNGPGPVDVHNSHSVWSALYLTSWKTNPHVVCRSCATWAQVRAILFSGVFGWWGFPFGLIMTPVQIVRNVAALFRQSSDTEPSDEIRRLARLTIASRMAAGGDS